MSEKFGAAALGPLSSTRAETLEIVGPGPKFDERYPLAAVRAGSYIYEQQVSLRDKAQQCSTNILFLRSM